MYNQYKKTNSHQKQFLNECFLRGAFGLFLADNNLLDKILKYDNPYEEMKKIQKALEDRKKIREFMDRRKAYYDKLEKEKSKYVDQ